MTEEERARRLFIAFQGREPIGRELALLDSCQKIPVLQVGDLAGLIYIAKGDGKRYIHQIKQVQRRPLLYASFDGAQTFIVGGAMKFTPRGFNE